MKRVNLACSCASDVASSREDAWIETRGMRNSVPRLHVASSREDAWIETLIRRFLDSMPESRPPARTRGLKLELFFALIDPLLSRPPARTRGLKPSLLEILVRVFVASSREDAWIETLYLTSEAVLAESRPPARTRGLKQASICRLLWHKGRVLPRGRVD